MNFKSFLPVSCLGLALALMAGCSKDEETSYSKKDPRISFVSIKGVNSRIVVNDYEHKIYNTDSLAYGTDISALPIFFAGYDVTTGIEVFKDGEWIPYSNKFTDTVKFDLSNLKIRSTSVDKSSTTEYTVSLRVRKFDVNAFVWKEETPLSIEGKVNGGKAVMSGGNCYYFFTAGDNELQCISSTDFKKWKSVTISGEVPSANFNWSSLIEEDGNVLLPYATDKENGILAISDLSSGKNLKASALETEASYLIPAIEGKSYGFSADSLYVKEDGAYKVVSALPKGVPTECVTSVVVPSGSRTHVAYIYGFNGDVASIWALDVSGKFMFLTSSERNAAFPVVKNTALAYVDNELCLVGGNDADGKFLNKFFTSSDAGLTWVANWHKEIPANVGAIASSSVVSVSDDELILLGGNTEKGPSLKVWRATLNGK